MKSTTPACADLLNNARQIYMVELLTLTLRDGTAIRWAMSDVDITYGAFTWVRGLLIERDAVQSTVGLEVGSMSMALHADAGVTVSGVPLLQAAWRGVLDGAEVKIEKGMTDAPGNPIAGTVHLWEGRVSDVGVNSTTVELSLKGFTEVLDTPVPVDVYQATCVNALYDSACGISKPANALNLTVQAGSTASVLKCAVTGAGVYDLGDLVFTGGANANVRRSVKVHTAGELQLSFPLLTAPNVGDTFTVYKGCDKRQGTCTAKFSNLARFKAFPFVPAPETAV